MLLKITFPRNFSTKEVKRSYWTERGQSDCGSCGWQKLKYPIVTDGSLPKTEILILRVKRRIVAIRAKNDAETLRTIFIAEYTDKGKINVSYFIKQNHCNIVYYLYVVSSIQKRFYLWESKINNLLWGGMKRYNPIYTKKIEISGWKVV